MNRTFENILFGSDEEDEMDPHLEPLSSRCNLSQLPQEENDLLSSPKHQLEMSLLALNENDEGQLSSDILLSSNCDAQMIEQSFSPIVPRKKNKRKTALTEENTLQNCEEGIPKPPPLPITPPSVTVLTKLLEEKEKRFWRNFALNEAKLFHQLNNFTINLY